MTMIDVAMAISIGCAIVLTAAVVVKMTSIGVSLESIHNDVQELNKYMSYTDDHLNEICERLAVIDQDLEQLPKKVERRG